MRSSSSTSPSMSTISVLRGVANSSLMAVSSFLTMSTMRSARGEDRQVFLDLLGDLLQLVGDLVAAERGQAGEAQLEDGLGLLLRQLVGAVVRHLVARIGDQLDQRRDVLRRPVARHQLLLAPRPGDGAWRMSLITSSMLATAMARPTRTWARSRALLSRNLVRRRHDLLAEGGEGLDHVLEVEAARAGRR